MLKQVLSLVPIEVAAPKFLLWTPTKFLHNITDRQEWHPTLLSVKLKNLQDFKPPVEKFLSELKVLSTMFAWKSQGQDYIVWGYGNRQ